VTLTDAAKLVAVLKGVYLREQFTEESPRAFLWLLEDLPVEAVMAAAKIHGTRSKWCPTPAELREIIAEQATPKMPAGDAWEWVQKQVRKCGRDGFAAVIFEDQAIKDAVRRVGWRRICDEDTSKGDFVRRDFDAALAAAQTERRRDVQSGQIEAPRLRAIS
jgi:hypothetical protein